MAEQGLDPDRLMNECGIDREALARNTNTVPFSRYLALLELAAREARDPLIGIQLAHGSGPEILGAVGFMFLASPRLIDGLKNLCLYANLLQDATHFQLKEGGDEVAFTYQLHKASDLLCRQDVEFSLALISRLVRMYGGADVQSIRFRHSPGADIGLYRKRLKASVAFEQPDNRLVIVGAAAETPGKMRDPNLALVLQEFLDDQIRRARAQRTLSEFLDEALLSGALPMQARAAQAALHIGVSEATMHRRLRDEGVTYGRIVNARRYETAKEYLRRSSIGVTEVAHQLGFAESASFTRAFRRWSGGVTPLKYRRAVQDEARLQRQGAAPDAISSR
ncbi:MAG: AraC family transcriptional regulator ligand-binding domain-containing protein [Pseudomonadota bacterium]